MYNVNFSPKLSWKKSSGLNDYMLQHEQTHFDITELYARILRKRLSEEIKTIKDVKKISSIGREITKQWEIEQNTYDDETDHSINKETQAEWNANV
jgi:predicted secreted Zn-dependent protease